MMNVLAQRPGPALLPALCPCLAAVFALQLAHSTHHPGTWRARTRVLTLTAQAAATYVPLLWIGESWGMMAGFFAGSLLLAVPGRAGWSLYLTASTVPLVLTRHDGEAAAVAHGIGLTLLTGLVVYGVSSLSVVVAGNQEVLRAQVRTAVTRERLRVARDLHDLLGYSLSAIMLKSELVHRLLPAAPDRARSEATEILGIARMAIIDLQQVTNGDADLSLADAARCALSTLASARIEVKADLACGVLPRKPDSVLSIVLREAVTNVLRHSSAQHCTVRAVRNGNAVLLEVANDGVRLGTEPGNTGSGLGNLTTRLTAIGGTFTTDVTPEGWFRMRAQAPVGPAYDEPAVRGEDDRGAQAPDRPTDTGEEVRTHRTRGWAPGPARAMTVTVLAGYTLVTLLHGAATESTGAGMAAFVGCLAVAFVLQLPHSLLRLRTWPVHRRVLSLTAQATAAYAPLLWIGPPWGMMAGFLTGSLLLSSGGRARWALYAAGALVIAPISLLSGRPAVQAAQLTVSALVSGLVVYGVSLLCALVARDHETRVASVRMAVARERLVVARELHALLGSSLSAVRLRMELVQRLLPASPARAHAEVAEVLGIAREAVADVRLLACGYRGRSTRPPARTRMRKTLQALSASKGV